MNGTSYEPRTVRTDPDRGEELGYECMCGTAIFSGDLRGFDYICPECGAIHPAEDVES
jgi:hypothetical protein